MIEFTNRVNLFLSLSEDESLFYLQKEDLSSPISEII